MLPFNLEQVCFPTSKMQHREYIHACKRWLDWPGEYVVTTKSVTKTLCLLWESLRGLIPSHFPVYSCEEEGKKVDRLISICMPLLQSMHCTVRARTHTQQHLPVRDNFRPIYMLPYNLLRRGSMGRKLRHLI
jgi:hypothetical protein